METMIGNFGYFTLGAFTLFLGIIASPYVYKMKMYIKRYFTRKKRKNTIEHMQNLLGIDVNDRINDLQEQINNLAEAKYIRDKNRKSNIRRDVREYLQELAETKKEIK